MLGHFPQRWKSNLARHIGAQLCWHFIYPHRWSWLLRKYHQIVHFPSKEIAHLLDEYSLGQHEKVQTLLHHSDGVESYRREGLPAICIEDQVKGLIGWNHNSRVLLSQHRQQVPPMHHGTTLRSDGVPQEGALQRLPRRRYVPRVTR